MRRDDSIQERAVVAFCAIFALALTSVILAVLIFGTHEYASAFVGF